MVVKKEKNENNSQFIWRICSDKDDGLIDMSWKELASLLNQELFEDENDYVDESALRKQYQAAKKFFNDVFKYNFDNNMIKELELKKEEIKKERYKLSAINAERNKKLRNDSRQELFYESIRDCIVKYPVPLLKHTIPQNVRENTQYVLTIADIHAGAIFQSETNSYSLDICAERFDYLLSQVIDFVVDKNINTINVLELGDSVQGILRLSDIKLNETSVVEATMFVARQISVFLNELSQYCNIEYYHVPTSNHSQTRPLASGRGELSSEDVEYIIANYIKDTLADNNRVNVHTATGQEYITFNIHGYDIVAMHGHQIKNISTSLKDLSMLHRIFYDIVFLAHFHGGQELNVGECITNDAEIIICPSFIGSDPYSDSIFKGAKASCKIYGISEYGAHTETYKIILN